MGLALTLPHGVSHTRVFSVTASRRASQKQQPHQFSLYAKTGAENEIELPSFFDRQTIVRHLRPLRLLLRKTARPVGEEERARKPIFLARGFLCG
jgi:hypothetical protein